MNVEFNGVSTGKEYQFEGLVADVAVTFYPGSKCPACDEIRMVQSVRAELESQKRPGDFDADPGNGSDYDNELERNEFDDWHIDFNPKNPGSWNGFLYPVDFPGGDYDGQVGSTFVNRPAVVKDKTGLIDGGIRSSLDGVGHLRVTPNFRHRFETCAICTSQKLRSKCGQWLDCVSWTVTYHVGRPSYHVVESKRRSVQPSATFLGAVNQFNQANGTKYPKEGCP